MLPDHHPMCLRKDRNRLQDPALKTHAHEFDGVQFIRSIYKILWTPEAIASKACTYKFCKLQIVIACK